MWVVPLEVLKEKVEYGDKLKLSYADSIYWRGYEIKLKEESEIDRSLGWWYYMQIGDLFHSDKRKGGYMRQYTDLDKV